jgi:hypothetical protein
MIVVGIYDHTERYNIITCSRSITLKFFLSFQTMPPIAGLTFDGATHLNDTDNTVQAIAGTATWVPIFSPVMEGSRKYIAEVLLCLLHTLGLCCGIVEFPAYMAGKIVAQPELLSVYTAYNTQMDSSDMDIFLQKTPYISFFFWAIRFSIRRPFLYPLWYGILYCKV